VGDADLPLVQEPPEENKPEPQRADQSNAQPLARKQPKHTLLRARMLEGLIALEAAAAHVLWVWSLSDSGVDFVLLIPDRHDSRAAFA
jgi:hypothetical protein